LVGRLWEVSGRGQALAPIVHIDEVAPTELVGRVSFGRFHAGQGAVHGGVIPLVFDEVMARLANSQGRSRARTAYLRTDYRAVVPLHTEVQVRSWWIAEEGRKRTMGAELRLEGEVLAECQGLWVALRPGQP
jgi:acyl-coenzyme A thioesterase PaaI-like protein